MTFVVRDIPKRIWESSDAWEVQRSRGLHQKRLVRTVFIETVLERDEALTFSRKLLRPSTVARALRCWLQPVDREHDARLHALFFVLLHLVRISAEVTGLEFLAAPGMGTARKYAAIDGE